MGQLEWACRFTAAVGGGGGGDVTLRRLERGRRTNG